MTDQHLADLLTQTMRDRARAYAELVETRAELREAQLELSVARELLAFHGITPVEDNP